MNEKSLFTVIAVLLVAFLGVGAYAAFKNPQAAAEIPPTAVEAVSSAVTDVTGSGENVPESTGTGAQTAPPVAGTQTTAGIYTMAQIAQHGSAASCYTAINGFVYDLTPFIGRHPGGPVILSLCGIDGTANFMAQHGGQGDPERELASLKIGILAQ